MAELWKRQVVVLTYINIYTVSLILNLVHEILDSLGEESPIAERFRKTICTTGYNIAHPLLPYADPSSSQAGEYLTYILSWWLKFPNIK